MRIIDWSSDVCSSDLGAGASLVERTLVDATGAVAHHPRQGDHLTYRARLRFHHDVDSPQVLFYVLAEDGTLAYERSEEHTSELQSLMRISYADFCLKKKRNTKQHTRRQTITRISATEK